MNIHDAFNDFAQEYDKSRRQFIPCFDDFYGTAIRLIPYNTSDCFKVLDLGAGTGLLSQFILAAFPNTEVLLVDIAENMLLEARKRFKNLGDQVTYQISDYRKAELADAPESFDIIASALSIHHLNSLEKQALFKNVFIVLKRNGLFINADLCAGETPEIEQNYQQDWLDKIRKSGLSESEVSAGLERSKFDKKDTLSSQLAWLKSTGFRNVNCWYSNFSFSVYSGQKIA